MTYFVLTNILFGGNKSKEFKNMALNGTQSVTDSVRQGMLCIMLKDLWGP